MVGEVKGRGVPVVSESSVGDPGGDGEEGLDALDAEANDHRAMHPALQQHYAPRFFLTVAWPVLVATFVSGVTPSVAVAATFPSVVALYLFLLLGWASSGGNCCRAYVRLLSSTGCDPRREEVQFTVQMERSRQSRHATPHAHTLGHTKFIYLFMLNNDVQLWNLAAAAASFAIFLPIASSFSNKVPSCIQLLAFSCSPSFSHHRSNLCMS